MRCYTHADIQAIGICRICGRALCRECLTEVKGHCCCKGRCEAAVKTPEEVKAELRANPGVQELQKTVMAFTHRTLRIAYVMPGLLLIVIGIALKLPPGVAGIVAYVLLAIGALLLLWYYYVLLKKKRAANS
jgi:hypothetical protein